MSDTRTVHDPFLGKDVQVSDRLVDRLRGKYASGPHLPNGNPEFGWRQFQAPPIQHEAAAEIERLSELAKLQGQEIRITRERDEGLEKALERISHLTFADGTLTKAAKIAREVLNGAVGGPR